MDYGYDMTPRTWYGFRQSTVRHAQLRQQRRLALVLVAEKFGCVASPVRIHQRDSRLYDRGYRSDNRFALTGLYNGRGESLVNLAALKVVRLSYAPRETLARLARNCGYDGILQNLLCCCSVALSWNSFRPRAQSYKMVLYAVRHHDLQGHGKIQAYPEEGPLRAMYSPSRTG